MSEPVLLIGSPRSGCSAVAAALSAGCGLSTAPDLLPPSPDAPLPTFESAGVVDAHRYVLEQLERDWSCPPARFDPDPLDLRPLAEQYEIHRSLPGTWLVKDPRLAFMLPAWAHSGLEHARLVGVVRSPADTIRSIERHHALREDYAEAIVDAYTDRLLEMATLFPLPVIRFSSNRDDLLDQLEGVAAAFNLAWDHEAASSCLQLDIVHTSAQPGATPAYDALLERRHDPTTGSVGAVALGELDLSSAPQPQLPVHLGSRYVQHRSELWGLAAFETAPDPIVADVVLSGSPAPTRVDRAATAAVYTVEVDGPLQVGARLMQQGLRPHGVVATGILAGATAADVQFFFRSVYINSHALAEVVVDVPALHGQGVRHVEPPPPDRPGLDRVTQIATECGWDRLATRRLSPARSGVAFRKRVLTDHELVPVVADLITSLDRIRAIEAGAPRPTAQPHRQQSPETGTSTEELNRLRRRAKRAEHDLARLRGRRSVRLALAAARPFRIVFSMVRNLKHRG